jgi:hypothetical protein
MELNVQHFTGEFDQEKRNFPVCENSENNNLSLKKA